MTDDFHPSPDKELVDNTETHQQLFGVAEGILFVILPSNICSRGNNVLDF